jgi:hypothetical protein
MLNVFLSTFASTPSSSSSSSIATILDGSLMRVTPASIINAMLQQQEDLRPLMQQDAPVFAYAREEHLREAAAVHYGSADKWRDYLQQLTGSNTRLCKLLPEIAGLTLYGGPKDMLRIARTVSTTS